MEDIYGALNPAIPGLLSPGGLGLMQAGLGMMAASGPSRTPTSFGQIMGQGGMQGLQAYQQALQAEEQRKMRLMQMMEQKRIHDAQIERYKADAEKDKESTTRARLEREYFARPEVQDLIRQGKVEDVMAGMPNLSGANLTSLATVLGNRNKAPMTRKMRRGEKEVTQEWRDGNWIDVAEGPAFAKQIAPSFTMPQPVQVIYEPKSDGKGYLARDARSGKVLSENALPPGAVASTMANDPDLQRRVAAGKAAGGVEGKREVNMQGLGAVVQEAEDILNGIRRDEKTGMPIAAEKPTGSGIGALVDKAAGVFGASPSGAVPAQQLKAIAGALTSKMPRMEGPQSDKDVQLYREMAAEVGNEFLPIDRRKAALRVVKTIWKKYEKIEDTGKPADISPELWNAMRPEERALWKK